MFRRAEALQHKLSQITSSEGLAPKSLEYEFEIIVEGLRPKNLEHYINILFGGVGPKPKPGIQSRDISAFGSSCPVPLRKCSRWPRCASARLRALAPTPGFSLGSPQCEPASKLKETPCKEIICGFCGILKPKAKSYQALYKTTAHMAYVGERLGSGRVLSDLLELSSSRGLPDRCSRTCLLALPGPSKCVKWRKAMAQNLQNGKKSHHVTHFREAGRC